MIPSDVLGFFEPYPDVDPHRFATAYVNHVESTGVRPEVYAAFAQWRATGSV